MEPPGQVSLFQGPFGATLGWEECMCVTRPGGNSCGGAWRCTLQQLGKNEQGFPVDLAAGHGHTGVPFLVAAVWLRGFLLLFPFPWRRGWS